MPFGDLYRPPTVAERMGDVAEAIDPVKVMLDLFRGLKSAEGAPAPESVSGSVGQMMQLPVALAAGGITPRSVSAGGRSIMDLIKFMSRQRGASQPAMVPDLEQAGLAAATRAFSKKYPGTSPEVMADIGGKEQAGKRLAAHARGAMAEYMGKNIGPVAEPADVSSARTQIARWEELLQQKFGGGNISDEAIARGSKLPLDLVRQLRSYPGYRASIDPISGMLERGKEGPVSARIIKSPQPEAPKADLDPIREAMAKTPAQKRLLELYEQDMPLREIARQTGMDASNARKLLDKMIERGRKAAGSPAKASYLGFQQGVTPTEGFHLYNLADDIKDPSGRILHSKGSTVGTETLDKYKIPYDKRDR